MRDVLRRMPSWLLLVAFAATIGAACDDSMSGTPLPTLPEEEPGSEDAPPAEDEPSPEPVPEPEPGPEPVPEPEPEPDPEPVPEPEPDFGDADDRVVPDDIDGEQRPAALDATTPHIEEVFLGQTHMLQLDDPYFGLVANRKALLEVHVVGDQERDRVRRVRAVLRLGGQRLAIRLHGPGVVPAPVERPEGPFDHRPDDAYTNVIPAAWVTPGLEIALRVEAVRPDEGDERPLYDWKLVTPRIGAPNPLHIDMFDVSFFGRYNFDYNPAELAELAEKMPVSGLDIQRVPAVFQTLVMPPRGNGVRAWRAASKEQYEMQAGVAFDGEQAASLQWVNALTRAGGRGRHRVTWVTIIGVLAGGQAANYHGVSRPKVSYLQHELGHALGLPHAGSDGNFPYRGPMFGIPVLNDNDRHVGPAWGIDLRADNGFDGRYFIPPTVQPETVAEQDRVGAWKRSPMQRSGVTQDYEQGFGLQMFSDYEIDRLRRSLEDNYLVWDAERASYFRWDAEAGAYAVPVPADGIDLPAVRDVAVVSLMASTSGSTPDISFVYPTIGPYQGGLPRLIDLSRPHDRAAVDARCARDGCDFAMRVVQGGVESVYLLDGRWLPDTPEDNVAGFVTTAINLPADAGEIESAELLLTLDGRLEGAMPLAAQP